MQSQLSRQVSIGSQIHGRFYGKTNRVASFDQKLRGVASDRKCGKRVGIGSQSTAETQPPLFARRMATSAPCGIIPCCDSQAAISSREIWDPVSDRVQIHNNERSDQAFRRNLSSGPGSGNERGRSNDAGLRI